MRIGLAHVPALERGVALLGSGGGGETGVAVRRWTGRGADALMSIEVGGLNGVLPLVAAVDLDVPCVDADLPRTDHRK